MLSFEPEANLPLPREYSTHLVLDFFRGVNSVTDGFPCLWTQLAGSVPLFNSQGD